MWGRRSGRLAAATLLLVVASCGDAENADSSSPPEPATEAEMELFCEKYETVSSQSWSELTAALIDVSPEEIRAEMIRASEPPGETWAEDLEAVEDFIARCNDL
jgi:hypothetical protein